VRQSPPKSSSAQSSHVPCELPRSLRDLDTGGAIVEAAAAERRRVGFEAQRAAAQAGLVEQLEGAAAVVVVAAAAVGVAADLARRADAVVETRVEDRVLAAREHGAGAAEIGIGAKLPTARDHDDARSPIVEAGAGELARPATQRELLAGKIGVLVESDLGSLRGSGNEPAGEQQRCNTKTEAHVSSLSSSKAPVSPRTLARPIGCYSQRMTRSDGARAASRCLCLAGPTASGKSSAALAIAAALSSRRAVEIISVDSALIYHGMSIGTAKPTDAERSQVVHHLIDMVDPAERYSAARFVADATRLIDEIAARGALPLLVGGTMLYFKALFDGIDTLPSAARCSTSRRCSTASTRCPRPTLPCAPGSTPRRRATAGPHCTPSWPASTPFRLRESRRTTHSASSARSRCSASAACR